VLKDAFILNNSIIEYIKNNIDSTDNVSIAIEGLSYGSIASRLAQISGYQYLLRERIYEVSNSLFVFSPKTVKMVAGKGNYNKEMMIKAFLASYLENEDQYETFKQVNEEIACACPFNDMIDAYWVVKTLQRYLKIRQFRKNIVDSKQKKQKEIK